MSKEQWKPIIGYEGYYEVSDLGRVRSIDRIVGRRHCRGRVRKLTVDNNGHYLKVQLCRDGVIETKQVHRLVAEAFVVNPNDYPQVNHKDENKRNNTVDNLEWCTHTYNMNYGSKPGKTTGENNKNHKLTSDDVRVIRSKLLAHESLSKIAETFNVSVQTIWNIKHGYKWRGVT